MIEAKNYKIQLSIMTLALTLTAGIYWFGEEELSLQQNAYQAQKSQLSKIYRAYQFLDQQRQLSRTYSRAYQQLAAQGFFGDPNTLRISITDHLVKTLQQNHALELKIDLDPGQPLGENQALPYNTQVTQIRSTLIHFESAFQHEGQFLNALQQIGQRLAQTFVQKCQVVRLSGESYLPFQFQSRGNIFVRCTLNHLNIQGLNNQENNS